jgi:hypothetical protein
MAHSGTILYYQTVPPLGDKWRELSHPLPCKMWPGYDGPEEISAGFRWDGNSTSILSPLYPKWNHPIASCRHDYRCWLAKNSAQRKWADGQYRLDVATTGWWITANAGYIGVRAGAMLGIGNSF